MPQGDAAALPSNPLLSPLRVVQASSALSSPHPLALRRFRSLNYSGFFLCLSGLLSVWMTVKLGAADVADVIALRFLAYACWLYGGLGLWTMLGPGAFEGTGLAALRGVRLPLGVACFSRLVLQIGRGIALSSLPVLALALWLSPDQVTQDARLLQFSFVLVYIAACALSLAVVGSLCISFAKRRARLCAILLLLVPFALDASGVPLPNVVGGLLWGFRELVAWGVP